MAQRGRLGRLAEIGVARQGWRGWRGGEVEAARVQGRGKEEGCILGPEILGFFQGRQIEGGYRRSG